MNSSEQGSERPFTTDSLPPYIDFPNDPIIPLPGLADNTRMYCFPIKADYGQLEKLCHQRLNWSPYTYTPIVSQVVVMFYHMHKSFTMDSSYKKGKQIKETAVLIVIPVLKFSYNSLRKKIELGLCLFIPYIFVDNPISMAIGREHVGFPKMMGKFKIPPLYDPINKLDFEVNPYGFKCFDDPDPLQQYPDYFPWLTINQKVKDTTAVPNNWTTREEAWAAIKKILGLPDLIVPFIPMVFLKQFRHIHSPQNACYKEVNEADVQLDTFNNAGELSGKFAVTFHPMDSYPIVNDLGLSNTNTVTNAFWIDADLKFDTGHTIWKAPS